MAGRPWTLEEDDEIRRMVRAHRDRPGILRDLAFMLGRTPAAVRKRAQRLGVAVYSARKLPGLAGQRFGGRK